MSEEPRDALGNIIKKRIQQEKSDDKFMRILFMIACIVAIALVIYSEPQQFQNNMNHLHDIENKINSMTCPELYKYAYEEFCGYRTGCLQNEEWQYANMTFYDRCNFNKVEHK